MASEEPGLRAASAAPITKEAFRRALAGSRSDQRRQWGELLEGYTQFADFDFREVALIEPLRTLRMLHHAAWVSHRWQDPAFPRAFPWFGEHRYWEGYVADLREQLEALDDPPLGGR